MAERTNINPKTEIPLEKASRIARLFALPESFKICDFPGKGNINRHTYLVTAGQSGEYILQMLNTSVFDRPDAVMDTMISCLQAQQKALSEGILEKEQRWDTIRLVPTKEGATYLKTGDAEHPQYWRMMHRIRNTGSYKSLREIQNPEKRLQIAEETGKGLALFGRLTAGMDTSSISSALPGYRDTGLYYTQLDSILDGSRTMEEASVFLPSDPALRQNTVHHFLVHQDSNHYRVRMEDKQVKKLAIIALEHRSFCLKLQRKLESGSLRASIVHGDTKLDNFLFDIRTGRVRALVDLDTVMPHTWLSDWGDMARSLINVSGEKRRNWNEIEINLDIFKALARGFIGSAFHLPGNEMELMVDAARIMALELGVRFLTDYLRGDTYFERSTDSPEDLNKIRAAVQFSVFQKLGAVATDANQYISHLNKKMHKDTGPVIYTRTP